MRLSLINLLLVSAAAAAPPTGFPYRLTFQAFGPGPNNAPAMPYTIIGFWDEGNQVYSVAPAGTMEPWSVVGNYIVPINESSTLDKNALLGGVAYSQDGGTLLTVTDVDWGLGTEIQPTSTMVICGAISGCALMWITSLLTPIVRSVRIMVNAWT